ncbi:hypothetical protein NM688_g3277 [Phlebia brevispora]|uniref:Uncharacterized protein n=1 Tax=Phlebia brevispora TaxID=194682 RepID=A0ACC1T6K4_9APHY|nr:hypothetical protein NM688_g3277 [Phlebia brevispora]
MLELLLPSLQRLALGAAALTKVKNSEPQIHRRHPSLQYLKLRFRSTASEVPQTYNFISRVYVHRLVIMTDRTDSPNFATIIKLAADPSNAFTGWPVEALTFAPPVACHTQIVQGLKKETLSSLSTMENLHFPESSHDSGVSKLIRGSNKLNTLKLDLYLVYPNNERDDTGYPLPPEDGRMFHFRVLDNDLPSLCTLILTVTARD